jgi:hypothetical protein
MLITLLTAVLIGLLFVGFLALAFKMSQPGYSRSILRTRQNGKPNFSIFSHNDSWIGPNGNDLLDSDSPKEEWTELGVDEIDLLTAKKGKGKPRGRQ